MNGVFRLSEGASLALHGMGVLALWGQRTSAAKIAQHLKVSQTHLAKVFQKLAHAGLVRSLRGASGGFELSRPANEITLLEIFQAVEGHESCQDHCILGLKKCPFNGCLFGEFPARMNREFMKQLGTSTLKDFVTPDDE